MLLRDLLLAKDASVMEDAARRATHLALDSTSTRVENADEQEGRWELVGSKTENEIFEGLGMEYVEPSRRNFSFIASRQKGGKKN